MRKFEFRLQKVLEFRRMEEDWAKDAFIRAQQARQEKQTDLERLAARRLAAIMLPAGKVAERIHLEHLMERMDDEERALRISLDVLTTEQDAAEFEWHSRRRAVKALERLREVAYHEWKLEFDRQEQNALDEWATLRQGQIARAA